MQKQSRHTYTAMNQDLSKSKYQPEIYYEGRNIYIVSENNQSTGSVSNQKGTELLFTIPDIEQTGVGVFKYKIGLFDTFYTTNQQLPSEFFPMKDQYIIGMEPILNDMLVFTTDNKSPTPNGLGCVWLLKTIGGNSLELIYMNKLDFSTKYPIEAEARYETEQVQHVYWTDRYNELRFLNLNDENLSDLPLDFVNIAASWEWGTIELDGLESGGNFTAGMVGWAYGYSNLNGQATKISPLTKLYNVNEVFQGNLVNDKLGRSFRIHISNVDTRFDLVNIYRVFYTSLDAEPQITLASKEYADKSDIYWVDDNNTLISTLSTNEFLAYGTDPFITGSIGTKNEYLFAADNRYPYFDIDFDARAYRFAAVGSESYPQQALLLNSAGAIETVINGMANPVVWPKEVTLDAINPSNKANTQFNPSQPNNHHNGAQDPNYNKFIYQSNGFTVGGEGPYLKYRFVETPIKVDALGSTQKNVGFDRFESLLNPIKQSLVGCKRDEVYRYGIRVFNNRGQYSFIKWIADIRIPPITDINTTIPTGVSDVNLNQLQIEFSWVKIPQGIVGYQIMRVERTSYESTIIAQGIINPFSQHTNESPGGGKESAKSNRKGKIQPIVAIDSYSTNSFNPGSANVPSNVYGNTVNSGGSSFMANYLGVSTSNVIRYQSYIEPNDNNELLHYQYFNYLAQFLSHEIDQFTPLTGGFFNIVGVSDVIKHGTIKHRVNTNNTFNTITYGYATVGGNHSNQEPNYWEVHTKCGQIRVQNIVRIDPYFDTLAFHNEGASINETYIMNFGSGGKFEYFITPYFRRMDGISDNGYGTAMENDSFNNKYIAIAISENTNFLLPNQLWNKVDNIGLYPPDLTPKLLIADYKRDLPNQYGGDSYEARSRNVYIPSGPYMLITQPPVPSWGDTWVTYHYFQSTATTETDIGSIQDDSTRYITQVPMECKIRHDLRVNEFMRDSKPFARFDETFQYNTVYHQDYDLNPIVPKPLGFKISERFIGETAYSDPKLNGEQIDSWTIWRPGNRKEVDNKYGRIVGLLENKDVLFFFQERAVGLWEVQPYKQTTTTDGGTLQLGVGSVLERRRYISTNNGCQHKFSLAKSTNGIVYYDQFNKAIRTLKENTEETSLIKGISTLLFHLPNYDDAPTDENGITCIYDSDRSEFIMAFLKTKNTASSASDNLTVKFSFIANGFTSIMDAHPRLLQSGADKVFAVHPNGHSINHWGTGKRGEFFGNIYDSSITIVMNAEPDVTKLLTNLKWNSEVYDKNGTPLHDIPVSHIEIWNDHQSTGKVDVTQMDFNQFKRLMRNWLFKVPFDNTDAMSRIRSQYFFVKLYIDNTNNYQHILHDLIATYILQPL